MATPVCVWFGGDWRICLSGYWKPRSRATSRQCELRTMGGSSYTSTRTRWPGVLQKYIAAPSMSLSLIISVGVLALSYEAPFRHSSLENPQPTLSPQEDDRLKLGDFSVPALHHGRNEGLYRKGYDPWPPILCLQSYSRFLSTLRQRGKI